MHHSYESCTAYKLWVGRVCEKVGVDCKSLKTRGIQPMTPIVALCEVFAGNYGDVGYFLRKLTPPYLRLMSLPISDEFSEIRRNTEALPALAGSRNCSSTPRASVDGSVYKVWISYQQLRSAVPGAASRAAGVGLGIDLVVKHATGRKRPCLIEPHCWTRMLPPDQYTAACLCFWSPHCGCPSSPLPMCAVLTRQLKSRRVTLSDETEGQCSDQKATGPGHSL